METGTTRARFERRRKKREREKKKTPLLEVSLSLFLTFFLPSVRPVVPFCFLPSLVLSLSLSLFLSHCNECFFLFLCVCIICDSTFLTIGFFRGGEFTHKREGRNRRKNKMPTQLLLFSLFSFAFFCPSQSQSSLSLSSLFSAIAPLDPLSGRSFSPRRASCLSPL